MTLAFFRRHRKWFMVLMILGVISMVFFQSWSYLPKLKEWLGAGPGSVPVGTIAGRKVTYDEVVDFYNNVRLGCEASRQLAATLFGQLKEPDAQEKAYRLTLEMSTGDMIAWRVRPELMDAMQVFFGDKPPLSSIMTWLALYDEGRARGLEVSDAAVETRLKGIEELGGRLCDGRRFLNG